MKYIWNRQVTQSSRLLLLCFFIFIITSHPNQDIALTSDKINSEECPLDVQVLKIVCGWCGYSDNETMWDDLPREELHYGFANLDRKIHSILQVTYSVMALRTGGKYIVNLSSSLSLPVILAPGKYWKCIFKVNPPCQDIQAIHVEIDGIWFSFSAGKTFNPFTTWPKHWTDVEKYKSNPVPLKTSYKPFFLSGLLFVCVWLKKTKRKR